MARIGSSPKSPQQHHNGSTTKAVLLLDEIIATGEQEKPRNDDEVVEGEQVHDMMSEHALTLERGANKKALQLLDITVADVTPAPAKSSKTVRQAMLEDYEQKKLEKLKTKDMIKAVKMHEKETRPVKLVAEKKLEKMATTTRKTKRRPEDVRDPDTVAGMKSELEIEKAKEAEEKALKMMDEQDTGLV